MAINTSSIPQVKQVATIFTHAGQTASTIKDTAQAVTSDPLSRDQNIRNAGISAIQLGDTIATIAGKELPGGPAYSAISLANNVSQINNLLSNNQAVDASLVTQAFSDISSILASGAFAAAAAAGSPAIAGLGAALVLTAGALTIIALAQGKDTVSPEFQEMLEDLYNAIQNYRNGDNGNFLLPLGGIDTRDCHPPIESSHPNAFAQSKAVPPPRRDPLVFDLDGDGIETVGTSAGVLFDHNGDNIATGTGWIKPDDGLLVRDINGNGTIDTGRELFGDRTLLSSGAQATDGYAALRDLDSNADGKIDSSDGAFGELKIWRDLNQDGISQADELISLADAGISAINLDAVAKNQAQNGNTIAATGSYTKTDGTTGATADVNLASDPSNRRFTDTIDIPETLIDLPDMTGSGKVRDLQEAATLSPTLADILARFGSAATRAEQMALLDELLLAWADTSGMAGSLDERDPRYRVEYLSFGNVRRSDHITGTTTAGTVTTAPTNTDNPLIDTTYRNLISQWNNNNRRNMGASKHEMGAERRAA